MSYSNAITRTAGDREAGVACPHCAAVVRLGEAVAVCQTCGTVHHQGCWAGAGRCGSYVCSPGRRELAPGAEPAMVISAAELERAAPLPARPTYVPPAPPIPPRPGTSGLGVAAMVFAVVGVPVLGWWTRSVPAMIFGGVMGFVGIVLGCLALGLIQRMRRRGVAFALVGVLLGLADMVGFVVLLALVGGIGHGPRYTLTEFRSDLSALKNLDPKIGQAMRANVMIESQGAGWKLLGGSAIGSGVILKLENGAALVITNRHVVDPKFTDEANANDKPGGVTLKVQLVDESIHPGEVVWVAPDGIDLALVRVACRNGEARAARWQMGRTRPPVGGAAFAIGNPQGLGWTHTQGTVSQYRIQDLGGREVPVIQTQTAINPGNSGGGLYDGEGYLIGINTWTQDKRMSEGLNFAIGLEVLSKLAPPFLDLRPVPEGPDQP